jgi:hypothetical protein
MRVEGRNGALAFRHQELRGIKPRNASAVPRCMMSLFEANRDHDQPTFIRSDRATPQSC